MLPGRELLNILLLFQHHGVIFPPLLLLRREDALGEAPEDCLQRQSAGLPEHPLQHLLSQIKGAPLCACKLLSHSLMNPSCTKFLQLDTDAHLIFREIMRIKLEGHTDKFVQQRSWFLEDIEEALTKISKPAQPPTVGSTGWAGDEPFFIRFSAVPHKTSIDTSGSACPPTVEPVTTPSPVAYTTPVKASSRFQRSVDPGRHSYYSDCSRYSENSGVHEEIFYQHDEWVSYQRFERSRARPRTNMYVSFFDHSHICILTV